MTTQKRRPSPNYGELPPRSYSGDYRQPHAEPGYAYPEPYAIHRTSWHIEKGVSISLIVFLVIQTVSIIWFASQLTQQVKQNTSDILSIQSDAKDRDKIRNEMSANLSSINQELHDIREFVLQPRTGGTNLIMPPSQPGVVPQINIQQSAPADLTGKGSR
jgi:hypothetical protein